MYAAFAKSAFQTRLAYRSQVWAQLLGQLVSVFAKVAIWMAAFGAAASVDDITLADMITYAVLAGAIMAWNWDSFLESIGEQISTGDVTVFLIKPLHYPMMLLAAETGNLVFRLVTVILPVAVLIALVYGLEPPASLFHGLMFMVFWAVAFGILFSLAMLAGLLAFWLMTSFSLGWFLGAFLNIFAGAFVPLWFYPQAAAAIISKLPFAFVGFHPMAVYLGRTGTAETLFLLALGLFWLVVLAGLVAWTWSRATRRLVVQGG
jgi:ABC-2 type transport system permease protein